MKVLFVLTSHDKKGDAGDTGFHFSEAAHPWKIITESGYEVEYVSPKGDKAPIDSFDLDDDINKEFWESEEKKLETTMKPEDVDPKEYVAIHFVGGHGTMWDLPHNEELQAITRRIYEQGGIVAAVCHGPAGIVNVKLSDGNYLVDGKTVNSFTDDEERKVELDEVVPFLLETKLKEHGAQFEKADVFEKKIVVDGHLVTGQNPASALGVGKEIVKLINSRSSKVHQDISTTK